MSAGGWVMLFAYSGKDEVRNRALFEQMYRQRYEIYVKRRKWGGLKPVGGLERDDFDTASAAYLVALDAEDEILAGLRLLRTNRPHILGELFPHLARDGVPAGPDILELTRFYVAPFPSSRAVRDWLVGVLCAGMIEYCLANDVRQITSVIDTFLLKLMLSMDWSVRPLGIPRPYPEGEAVAVIVDITPEMLDSTRLAKGVVGSVLARPGFERARIPAAIRTQAIVPAHLLQ
jgi:acyl-homoserine lactone synthase